MVIPDKRLPPKETNI